MKNLYIIWRDEYDLGIPIIDEQHRAIVSTINTYHYFVTQGKTAKILKPTFVTLSQYAKVHFMTEETILETAEYPDLTNHKKLHTELTKNIFRIAKEATQEKDYDIVLNFLRNWWLHHIRIEDAKYASQVKETLKNS